MGCNSILFIKIAVLYQNSMIIVIYMLQIASYYCLIKIIKMISTNPFEIKGQSFTEQDYLNAIDKKRLLEAEFNVSPSCNLSCPFCYTNSNDYKGYKFVSLEQIDLFLKQVSEAGARTVRIVGIGEPFLDKRFFDGKQFPFLDLAEKHGITTVAYTNGTKIDKGLAKRLMDHDVSIVTKLYSLSPRTFEEMTGEKRYFSEKNQIKLVDGKYIPINLVRLIEAGFNKETPTRLGINNVITTQNINELEVLYQFARFNNIAVRFSGFLAGQRDLDNRYIVPFERLLTEYRKLIGWENKFSGYSWQPFGEIVGGQCSRLGFNITLDGMNFKLCCGENSYLADENNKPINLSNMSIKSIVEKHSLFEKIRTARQDNKSFRCVMSENINSQVGGYDG